MEMKNICGKIPLDLHDKVREEIELSESSTQKFLQQVIEEHFSRKGESSMGVKTVAVQVSEELFARLKTVIAHKGCKQKDFLIELLEKALEAEERAYQEENDTLAETDEYEEDTSVEGTNESEETESDEIEGEESEESEESEDKESEDEADYEETDDAEDEESNEASDDEADEEELEA